MAQSVEHATAAQTVSGSTSGHSVLFGQNLRTSVDCERIGKMKTVITLACASVTNDVSSKKNFSGEIQPVIFQLWVNFFQREPVPNFHRLFKEQIWFEKIVFQEI